ncbi:hypothetical protein ACLOJK_039878 [Asimina triloba]
MPERNECTWVEMISGYAKAGQMDDARGLIDTLLPPRDRNAVICTAMIAGHAKCGDISAARMVFDQIIDGDVASCHLCILPSRPPSVAKKEKPNQATMAAVISTCAQVGYAELAQKIEDYVNRHSHSLLNLRFMIKGFLVLEEGLQPDSICFIGVLSACSHKGLVVDGYHYFESMKNDYSIPPTADHYMCPVDLLGCAGRIEEGYRIITTEMHLVQPRADIWEVLLSASGSTAMLNWEREQPCIYCSWNHTTQGTIYCFQISMQRLKGGRMLPVSEPA